MKFAIGDLTPEKHAPNSYELEIRAMSGDADAYHKFTVGPFLKDEDEPALQHLIETLTRMKEEYPNGRGGYDSEYDHIEGFYNWFDEDAAEKSNTLVQDFLRKRKINLYWPYDATDEESSASYDSHEVFYYDDNRKQHSVTVTK